MSSEKEHIAKNVSFNINLVSSTQLCVLNFRYCIIPDLEWGVISDLSIEQ